MNPKTNFNCWMSCAVIVLGLLLSVTHRVEAQSHATARKQATKVQAFRVGYLVSGEGPVLKDAMMIVKKGKIVSIGKNLALPAGLEAIDLGEDAWVFPGMVNCLTQASVPNDLKEPRDAIDLDNKSLSVIVAGHRDFDLLSSAGVTSVVVMPDAHGVVSGIAAVVKTNKGARPVTEAGPVALALTSTTQKTNRFPTSLMGAFQLLGQTLSKPQSPILKAVAENKRASIVRVNTEAEVRAFLRIANTLGVKCAMATDGSIALRRALGQIKEPMAIILPALSLASHRRAQLMPALLEKKSHQVAFSSAMPGRSPEDLRFGASLAVHMGMSRLAALRAVTKNPAQIAGVGKRIGTLAKGKDADFIVLSGRLLDASAELQQTWIDGEQVYKRSSPTAGANK